MPSPGCQRPRLTWTTAERSTGRRTRHRFGRVKGLLALVVATLLVAGAAGDAAGAAARLSPSVYPAPVPVVHTGALSSCPNPRGLVPFTPTAVRAAAHEASDYLQVSLAAERLVSDRSFWTSIQPRTQGPSSSAEPFAAEPAIGATGPGHLIIGHSCGTRLLDRTETVVIVPLQANGQPQTCLACRASFFYIDRLGHELLYFVY
jgi:hypothetical protein